MSLNVTNANGQNGVRQISGKPLTRILVEESFGKKTEFGRKKTPQKRRAPFV
jgi:hypothetical protein